MFSTMWRCLAASIPIIVLVLLLPGRVRAQREVQGLVTSESTGEPLADVHVYVPRLKRGTVTDQDGHYTLTNLAPGAWIIEFSRLGFEKRVHSLGVGEALTTLDVMLRTETLEAGEVVVLADNPRHTADVPLQTLSIDQTDRIEEGRMSLWEDLSRWPGMARSTNGPGIERPYIRGLSAGRILLLMQGLPYAYQTWDPEAGLSTNGNGTEQVDVIQGPATLRYGPGAMGGVIDLTPEYPAPVGQTRGSYTAGLYSNSEGLYSDLALKQTRKDWFWGVRGSFDSHADYKAGGESEPGAEGGGGEEEGRVPNSRYDHIHAQIFGGLSRDWGSTRLTYQFLRHRNGIVEAEEEAGGEKEGEREIKPPYHALRDHLLTSDTQIQLGKGWLHGVVGLQINQQQEFEPAGNTNGEPAGEAAVDLNLATFHSRFDYEVSLTEAWSLTAGLQGSVQNNESEGGEPFIPSSDRKQAGAFGLFAWRQDQIVIEGGLRYDFQRLGTSPAKSEEQGIGSVEPGGEEAEIEREFGLVSGSVGGTYLAGEGRFVKVNLGIGNRAPDVAELTANGLLREVRRFLVGDADLDAEYNVEMDATFGWKFPAATVSAGAFYNRIQNYTYLFANGESMEDFPVYLYRQADANFKGGHAGVTLHPQELRALSLFSRIDVVMAELKDSPGYDAPMIPASHVISGVEIKGRAMRPFRQLKLKAEIDTYLKQDRVPPWEMPTEAYSLVNVSVNGQVAWGARTVLIGLHGLNLLDKEYTSHLSLLKPDGIRNMGRSITVSAMVPFGW